MPLSCFRPSYGPARLAIKPFGVTTDWNLMEWTRLCPLYNGHKRVHYIMDINESIPLYTGFFDDHGVCIQVLLFRPQTPSNSVMVHLGHVWHQPGSLALFVTTMAD